jgi:hypothetical protein
MRKIIIACVLILGAEVAYGQSRPQLDKLLEQERQKRSSINDFVSNFDSIEGERRNYIALIKSQIDTLKMSDSKRYKIMRDIYQGKAAPWISKYQLKTAPKTNLL